MIVALLCSPLILCMLSVLATELIIQPTSGSFRIKYLRCLLVHILTQTLCRYISSIFIKLLLYFRLLPHRKRFILVRQTGRFDLSNIRWLRAHELKLLHAHIISKVICRLYDSWLMKCFFVANCLDFRLATMDSYVVLMVDIILDTCCHTMWSLCLILICCAIFQILWWCVVSRWLVGSDVLDAYAFAF